MKDQNQNKKVHNFLETTKKSTVDSRFVGLFFYFCQKSKIFHFVPFYSGISSETMNHANKPQIPQDQAVHLQPV